MTKPSLFIGSSSEGLEFARAVRTLLSHDAEVTIWNEGLFGAGHIIIDTLINALPRFDFAVLVLAPDDLVISRESTSFGPRDNVIFELGLFMGRLGRSRTLILHEREAALKIPTDLAGIMLATYEWPRADRDHQAAVGVACDSIRRVVRDLGVSDRRAAKVIGDISSRQEQQQQELSTQRAQIRALQVALQAIVTQYEFDKLVGLERDDEFMCYFADDLYDELKHLWAMGLINCYEDTALTTIWRDYKGRDEQFDLKRFYYITVAGREYLKLRRDIQNVDSIEVRQDTEQAQAEVEGIYRRHLGSVGARSSAAYICQQAGRAYDEIHHFNVQRGVWKEPRTFDHTLVWFMAGWIKEHLDSDVARSLSQAELALRITNQILAYLRMPAG
jgi:hypothetical protein